MVMIVFVSTATVMVMAHFREMGRNKQRQTQLGIKRIDNGAHTFPDYRSQAKWVFSRFIRHSHDAVLVICVRLSSGLYQRDHLPVVLSRTAWDNYFSSDLSWPALDVLLIILHRIVFWNFAGGREAYFRPFLAYYLFKVCNYSLTIINTLYHVEYPRTTAQRFWISASFASINIFHNSRCRGNRVQSLQATKFLLQSWVGPFIRWLFHNDICRHQGGARDSICKD